MQNGDDDSEATDAVKKYLDAIAEKNVQVASSQKETEKGRRFISKYGKMPVRFWLPHKNDDTKNSPQSLEAVEIRNRTQDIKLRRMIAYFAILFVAVQLICSNVFFRSYLYHNINHIESSIMITWMSSSVVEIVAILGIVATSLFPNHDNTGRSGKTAKQLLSERTSGSSNDSKSEN